MNTKHIAFSYTAPVVPQVTIQDGEIVLDTSSLFVQRIPVPPENPTVNPRAPPGPPVTNRTKHFLSRNAQYVKRIWSPLELQVFYDVRQTRYRLCSLYLTYFHHFRDCLCTEQISLK